MVNIFTFPLRYLTLIDESRRPLFLRDIWGVLILSIILSAPFWFSEANYFGEGGFLDKFGSFSGVLTGFYVAALVAVASFASAGQSLDDVIELGSITGPLGDGTVGKLTRRQYVCSMFGYLSFVSLVLSLGAVLVVVVAGVAAAMLDQLATTTGLPWVRTSASNLMLFMINGLLAHMVATTCHGLYYLIDRLYAQKAVLLDKNGMPAA